MFRHKTLFWSTVLLSVTLDLVTKSLAYQKLGVDVTAYQSYAEFIAEPQPVEPLVGDNVRLVALVNPGMMWGSFREYSHLLIWIRIGALFLIYAMLRSFAGGQRLSQFALGGIFGGALGNLHDSIRYIGVRDFLELDFGCNPFNPFPAFNFADAIICCGVVILGCGLLFLSRDPQSKVESPVADRDSNPPPSS